MFKINCLNPIAKIGLDLLTNNYEKIDNFSDADAALVRSASVHELELPKSMLAIARAGAGVNNIPLDKCAEKGIVVFNTPGANANGVKELVIAGLMLAARDIVGGVNWVTASKEEPDLAKLVEKAKAKFAGTEIKGKKLGVIGLGAIGVLVANAAYGLDMEVVGYDPFISVEAAWKLSRNIKPGKSLEEVCRECDYLSIHVPASDKTKGMINKDVLDVMQDGAVVLNFSRDSLINDDDMIAALKSGKIRKYVTDFPNNKIAGVENVVAIPHLGASTNESEDNCAIMAVNQLMDYLENGNIKNSVNYPDCDLGACNYASRIAINYKNKPNMLSQFTTVLAAVNINIPDMINKSRGEWAYCMLDIEAAANPDLIKKIEAIDGVLRVRIIK
jgi:D-3-phosphoglycerate dehydrogenase